MNRKTEAFIGFGAIGLWWWSKNRVQPDQVVTTARAANTNVYGSYFALNTGSSIPQNTLVPVFNITPFFENNHIKFSINNAGTFNFTIKKVGGGVFQSGTIIAPTAQIYLSNVIENTGDSYELTINNFSVTIATPNQTQNDIDFTDRDLND